MSMVGLRKILRILRLCAFCPIGVLTLVSTVYSDQSLGGVQKIQACRDFNYQERLGLLAPKLQLFPRLYHW